MKKVPAKFSGATFRPVYKHYNPRRKGTQGWEAYEWLRVKGDATSEEILRAGIELNHLLWDIGQLNVVCDRSPLFHDVSGTAGEASTASSDEVLPEEWDKIVGLSRLRQNVLMVGPSGCGKTYISKRLSEELSLQFASISCSEGMSETQLTGWLLPGKGGDFAYRRSPFVRCYEDGGVFLLDEIDAANENTLVVINQALANDGFTIPQRGEGQDWVEKHRDFVCVAAANTFGHGESMIYHGRNALDGATLDRFRAGMVFMTYSKEVEDHLVAEAVLRWGRKLRDVIDRHGFPRVMSTRAMIEYTRQFNELGWDQKDWERSYLADWTVEEKSVAKSEGAIL